MRGVEPRTDMLALSPLITTVSTITSRVLSSPSLEASTEKAGCVCGLVRSNPKPGAAGNADGPTVTPASHRPHHGSTNSIGRWNSVGCESLSCELMSFSLTKVYVVSRAHAGQLG